MNAEISSLCKIGIHAWFHSIGDKGCSIQGNPERRRTISPGRRCIRTLTSLSAELKTKLQRQIISAHANGPYSI